MSDVARVWAARQQIDDVDKRRVLLWLAERHEMGAPLRISLPNLGGQLGLTPAAIWMVLTSFMHGGLIRIPSGIGEFATLELALPELDEGGDE